MTIDAARQAAAGATPYGDETAPIAEADANIFDCPSCRRPLAVGTSRCPGCRTRLIAGVRATRATAFILGGLVPGLLLGGGIVGAIALVAQPSLLGAPPAAGPVVASSAAPAIDHPAPSAATVVAPAAPAADIPASASTALGQSLLVDDHLAVDAARLRATLATARPSAADIARSLRALAATAAFGDRIAPGIGAWDAAVDVSARLVAGYAAIGATAREGLAASITNRAAYVRAVRALLGVLDDLAATDAQARTLAGSAGMPPSDATPASTAP